jgi:hypothetical protein
MKHIWCIDEDKYTLDEGYVCTDYKNYEDDFVYSDETQKQIIGTYKTENIFDNIETAKHILKGMIQIQRDKNTREIERLQIENERLFEKLLNV